jgi:hypothetical protein
LIAKDLVASLLKKKELHISWKSTNKIRKESVRWIPIAICNMKRNFTGNYHKIRKKYLQLYLNVFVYKRNPRYFKERIFYRRVIANINGL